MKRFLLTTAALLASTPALAAEEGHHGVWTFRVEGFYIIDFVVFIALLVWFVKKPAKKFLEDRYNRITAEIQTASRLKAEADAKLAEVKAKMDGLDGETRTIRAQFQADGERERERILAEADAQVEKLNANVAKQLEQETAALNEQLASELAQAVMVLAETKVKAKIDGATHKALTGSYIDGLEKLERLSSLEKAA